MRILSFIIRKEFRQLGRDKRMLPMLFAAPLIQVLLFGHAANYDVRNVPLLIVDRDRTSASRALVARFVSSGYFERAGTADAVRRVEPRLLRGEAQAALVIGRGYGAKLRRGEAPEVQYIADGSDATSAGIGLSYAGRIVRALGAELVAARREGAFRSPPGAVELVPRVWYNPDLKSRWFYVPAVLAMVLLMTTMILPSMAVVREKEIGTLEQLIVTPLRPWQLIVGKLCPFALIGFANLVLIALFVVWRFGVPFRGSFPLFLLFTAPFLVSTLGLGLFISTLVRTQQQAMMASIYLFMVPQIYLSGLIFPIENMPAAVRQITYLVPLRYYAVILRGFFLKGSGFAVLWPQALALLIFGTGIVAAASARFRKTLD